MPRTSLFDPSSGRARIPCEACGAETEVSEHTHAEVALGGWKIPCWSCGASVTIPPHPSTVEADRRRRELVGMGMLAAGDIERGKAMLDTAKREED